MDALNVNEGVEAITLEPFRRDIAPVDAWHTFRVRNPLPDAKNKFHYQYYRGESLWNWVRTSDTDPARNRVWYEDWFALHNAYDPGGRVPEFVDQLPMREKNTSRVPRMDSVSPPRVRRGGTFLPNGEVSGWSRTEDPVLTNWLDRMARNQDRNARRYPRNSRPLSMDEMEQMTTQELREYYEAERQV